jgi:hypothetical protein
MVSIQWLDMLQEMDCLAQIKSYQNMFNPSEPSQIYRH